MKQLIMLAIIASTALTMSAQNEQADSAKVKKERTIALWGHVYDSFTKAGALEFYVIDSKENNCLAVVTYIGSFLELDPHLVLIKGEGLDVYLEIVPQCCYTCGVKVQAAVIF